MQARVIVLLFPKSSSVSLYATAHRIIVSHRRVKWLGHLAKMPDERLPKRVLFGYMDGSAQESGAMDELCQGSPAICKILIHTVEDIPRQGRLKGCYRLYLQST